MTTAADMPKVGEVLAGKYQLVQQLGVGGMGAVYEAEHLGIGKRVAIKVLLPDAVKQMPGAVERFVREARAASAIGHHGIIDVHDIGMTPEGACFQVMELLRGASLGDLLRRRPMLDTPLAAYVICQVLSALDAAHRAGIVHRDLKPDNVFLTHKGQALPDVKLLDFGISQMLDPARPDERLTQSGAVLGTPFYMAPEQAEGRKDIDHRADIWAAGVLLYRCVMGFPPFQADNLLALVRSILTDPVPPMRSVRPDVPEALEAVILTALQKDRVGRYPTAADMQRALLPFVEANAAPLISLAAEVTRYDAPTPAGRFGGITADDLIPLPGGQNASTDMSWESGKGASRRKLGLWLGLGAGAAVLFLVVFAGVFFAFHKSGDRASPPPHPTVASSPATPASPPPVVASSPANSASPSPIVSQPPVQLPAPAVAPDPASDIVTITLRGVPEGAAVYLDDAQVDGTELRLRRSSEMRRVRVEQPGFEPWSHMITAEQDATHEVRLVSREQEPEARDPAPQGRHVERRQPQRPEETSRPRPPASPPVNHGWGGDQGFQREF